MERGRKGEGAERAWVAVDRLRGMRTPEGNPCGSIWGKDRETARRLLFPWGKYESTQFTLTWLTAPGLSILKQQKITGPPKHVRLEQPYNQREEKHGKIVPYVPPGQVRRDQIFYKWSCESSGRKTLNHFYHLKGAKVFLRMAQNQDVIKERLINWFKKKLILQVPLKAKYK